MIDIAPLILRSLSLDSTNQNVHINVWTGWVSCVRLSVLFSFFVSFAYLLSLSIPQESPLSRIHFHILPLWMCKLPTDCNLRHWQEAKYSCIQIFLSSIVDFSLVVLVLLLLYRSNFLRLWDPSEYFFSSMLPVFSLSRTILLILILIYIARCLDRYPESIHFMYIVQSSEMSELPKQRYSYVCLLKVPMNWEQGKVPCHWSPYLLQKRLFQFVHTWAKLG